MRRAVILPFATDSGGTYFYDDVTGTVFPAWPSLCELIRAHADMSLEEASASLEASYTTLDIQRSKQFVSHWIETYEAFYRTSDASHPFQDSDSDPLSARLERALAASGYHHLVLGLTEDCNLACRYCAYSSEYPLTRTASKQRMTFATGARAIDYFCTQAREQVLRNPWREIVVSFYGGEPLLNFDLLRQLVEYAEKRAPAPVRFSVTTNGLLLTASVSEFLVAHGVAVMVSLDGPATEHDRNRVLPNGSGTFARVVANVRDFRRRHPTTRSLSFEAVMDYRTDLARLEAFYEELSSTVGGLGRVTLVSPYNTTYYDRFTASEREAFYSGMRELEMRYVAACKEGRPVTALQAAVFGEMSHTIARRRRHGDTKGGGLVYTGACVPGRKLYVRPDGRFDICERVSGTCPIGDVERGIDWAAVSKVVRDYLREVCHTCWQCPVSKCCPMCYATTEGANGFRQSPAECERIRTEIGRAFSRVFSVREFQPRAYDPPAGRRESVLEPS